MSKTITSFEMLRGIRSFIMKAFIKNDSLAQLMAHYVEQDYVQVLDRKIKGGTLDEETEKFYKEKMDTLKKLGTDSKKWQKVVGKIFSRIKVPSHALDDMASDMVVNFIQSGYLNKYLKKQVDPLALDEDGGEALRKLRNTFSLMVNSRLKNELKTYNKNLKRYEERVDEDGNQVDIEQPEEVSKSDLMKLMKDFVKKMSRMPDVKVKGVSVPFFEDVAKLVVTSIVTNKKFSFKNDIEVGLREKYYEEYDVDIVRNSFARMWKDFRREALDFFQEEEVALPSKVRDKFTASKTLSKIATEFYSKEVKSYLLRYNDILTKISK